MKWFLILLGALVVLAAAAICVGALLPETHIARSRAVFPRSSPERVWELLGDLERWPQWHPAIREVRRLPDREGRPTYLQVGEWGEMPTLIERLDPPRRLITRIPTDAGLGFGGTWTFDVAPEGAGSRIEVVEAGIVESSLFRLFSVFSDRHAGIEQTLRALATALGETATPERVEG